MCTSFHVAQLMGKQHGMTHLLFWGHAGTRSWGAGQGRRQGTAYGPSPSSARDQALWQGINAAELPLNSLKPIIPLHSHVQQQQQPQQQQQQQPGCRQQWQRQRQLDEISPWRFFCLTHHPSPWLADGCLCLALSKPACLPSPNHPVSQPKLTALLSYSSPLTLLLPTSCCEACRSHSS